MPDIMTEAEIAELRALEAAATPGPWRHYRAPLRPALSPVIVNEVQAPRSVVVKWAGFDESSVSQRRHAANAAFIADARNAMPRLLAMIDAERAEVARRRVAAHVRPMIERKET